MHEWIDETGTTRLRGHVAPGLTGPITVTVADVPADQSTFKIYTPARGSLIYDILESFPVSWNQSAVADLYDGDPATGMNLGATGNTNWGTDSTTIDAFGARSFVSILGLTGGSSGDNFPYLSTGEPITLLMTYLPPYTAPVTAVVQGTRTFTLDMSGPPLPAAVAPGAKFTIAGSTGNDGTYTVAVVGPVVGPPFTQDVTVVEAIPSAVGDGTFTFSLVPSVGTTQFYVDDRGSPIPR